MSAEIKEQKEIKLALVVDTATTEEERKCGTGVHVYDLVGIECLDDKYLKHVFIIQTKDDIPALANGAGRKLTVDIFKALFAMALTVHNMTDDQLAHEFEKMVTKSHPNQ